MPISTLTYAIGDVHGRADLLRPLIDFIATDAAERGREPRVFFLGDIVDRGPDSRGALDLVAATLRRWPRSRLVLGNHDDAFLHAMTADPPDADTVAVWLDNGGDRTLLGYAEGGDLAAARAVFGRDCAEQARLLRAASLIEVDGRYAFVHAGIDPARPVDRQERRDCLTIRRRFLDHAGPLSHVVVHGHTITETRRPTLSESRISIDTGAFATGRLTAAVIDPAEPDVRFAMTAAGGGTISVGYGDATDRRDVEHR